MRNKITEKQTITKEIEVLIKETVTCNKCGKTIEPDYASDMQIFHLSFGYESKFDLESWLFDVCDDCLLDIIRTFKLVPQGFFEDRDHNTIDNIKEHQKIFDYWKETGEWDELKFKTYENLVKLNGYINTVYINEAIQKYHPNMPLLEDDDEDEE